jgi:hypothetical protein
MQKKVRVRMRARYLHAKSKFVFKKNVVKNVGADGIVAPVCRN